MTDTEDDDTRRRQQALGFLGSLPDLIGNAFTLLFWGALILGGGFLLMRAFPQIGTWIEQNIPQVAQFINQITGGRIFPDIVNRTIDNMTDAQAREQLPSMSVPAEIANIVAADSATWARVKAILHEASTDPQHRIMADTFTNPRTMLLLMQREPVMVRSILAAVMRPPAVGTDGQPVAGQMTAAQRTQFIGIVQGILGDRANMNTLLNAQNIDNTVALFQQVCPVQFAPGTLKAFIQTVGMQGGQVTAEFQAFITATVTAATAPDAATQATAAASVRTTFLNMIKAADPANPQQMEAIAQLANGARIPTENGQSVQPPELRLMGNRQNAAATVTLLRRLEAQQPGSATTFLESTSNGQFQQMISQNPAMQAALMEWYSHLDRNAVPQELQQVVNMIPLIANPEVTRAFQPVAGTAAVQFVMQPVTEPRVDLVTFAADQERAQRENTQPRYQASQLSREDRVFMAMTNGETRAELNRDGNLGHIGDALAAALRGNAITDPKAQTAARFLATTARRPDGSLYYVNIAAANRLAETIERNPANNADDASKARARNVTYAIYRMANGDNSVFNALPPQDIADFFSDKTNRDAVGTFLNTIDVHNLPTEYRNLFTYLKANWLIPGIVDSGISCALKYPGAVRAMQGHDDWGIQNDWWPVDDWGALAWNRSILEGLQARVPHTPPSGTPPRYPVAPVSPGSTPQAPAPIVGRAADGSPVVAPTQ